ncbi:hypothetical protein V502_02323 [Pseudogymnoascus sp. VKM F-4520 (FW-2644)]|nr:hypothetical protein V502_02323 [Pseudogymnoascus sp. VKM F-4520 (FW-2644)]
MNQTDSQSSAIILFDHSNPQSDDAEAIGFVYPDFTDHHQFVECQYPVHPFQQNSYLSSHSTTEDGIDHHGSTLTGEGAELAYALGFVDGITQPSQPQPNYLGNFQNQARFQPALNTVYYPATSHEFCGNALQFCEPAVRSDYPWNIQHRILFEQAPITATYTGYQQTSHSFSGVTPPQTRSGYAGNFSAQTLSEQAASTPTSPHAFGALTPRQTHSDYSRNSQVLIKQAPSTASRARQRRQSPCMACRISKSRCNKNATAEEFRCLRCIRQQIPRFVYRNRVTDFKPYEKWKNKLYEEQFTSVMADIVAIIAHCFEMYTALHLMMIGWQFPGEENEESLGMSTVEDKTSPLFGRKPVPRMVVNQLNHQLELRMAELDDKILRGIDEIIVQSSDRRNGVVAILATVLLLHIREVDAGRNIYWKRVKDVFGFWIHPSKPKELIEEAAASCNCLLSHFHYTIGRKPLEMNWDEKKSKDLVDNDRMFIESIKAIQAYAYEMNKHGLIGRKACDLYEPGNPNSVGFTASSLLFGTPKESLEVEGFY